MLYDAYYVFRAKRSLNEWLKGEGVYASSIGDELVGPVMWKNRQGGRVVGGPLEAMSSMKLLFLARMKRVVFHQAGLKLPDWLSVSEQSFDSMWDVDVFDFDIVIAEDVLAGCDLLSEGLGIEQISAIRRSIIRG